MHVAFRKLIGEDPLSRDLYLNHSLKFDAVKKAFFVLDYLKWGDGALKDHLLDPK